MRHSWRDGVTCKCPLLCAGTRWLVRGRKDDGYEVRGTCCVLWSDLLREVLRAALRAVQCAALQVIFCEVSIAVDGTIPKVEIVN